MCGDALLYGNAKRVLAQKHHFFSNPWPWIITTTRILMKMFLPREALSRLLGMLHVPLLHGGIREVLLLSSLSTDNPLTFTFACIILVVSVTLLELFRLLSWWVENKYSGGSSGMGSSCGCKQCSSLTACIGERREYDTIHDAGSPSRGESSPHLVVTTPSNIEGWISWVSIGILQFFIYVFSTFLMLIAMTMNIYLIISMAFGSMFGKMTVVLLKKKLMEARK
ncbi:uncharacterized protein [Macrobrachium rosenbergii]|uniref:uncharacterized protein isoform X2 n=1 Tax=Macrobrachium rosenbergii TaxID=79674 RepID=UPI0034D3A1BD